MTKFVVFILIFMVIFFGGIVLYQFHEWTNENIILKNNNDLDYVLILEIKKIKYQIIGGIVVIIGLIIAGWRADSAAKTAIASLSSSEAALEQAKASTKTSEAAIEQAKASFNLSEVAQKNAQTAYEQSKFVAQQAEISKNSLLAERFTKALEHISNDDKLEVRIGGIYSLEEIAVESKRDGEIILKILSSYLQNNSSTITEKDKVELESNQMEDYRISSDAQAVINVFRNLSKKGYSLDGIELTKLYLHGANFSGGNFCGVNFQGSILKYADFSNSNVESTNFFGSDLYCSNFSSAKMNKETRIFQDKTKSVNFKDCQLLNLRFGGCSLNNCKFESAILRNIEVSSVSFDQGNFKNATLDNFICGEVAVGFKNVNFENAKIINSDLQNTGGLKVEQLTKVQSLYNSKFPEDIQTELESDHSHLFETLKDED